MPLSVAPSLASPAVRPPQGCDVDVWDIDLDTAPADAITLLDDAERARAQAFVHSHHRQRYIAAHAAMRRVLGRYLGVPPKVLQFDLGPYGKPALQQTPGTPSLHFNLSHSGNRALLAVGGSQPLGVDLEAVRPGVPDPALTALVLTQDERRQYDELPPAQRTPAFFSLWARKEACMKAVGLGLALEPGSLHVGLDLAPQSLQIPPSADRIELTVLHGPDGFAAALAVEGGIGRITRHRLDSACGSWH